MPGLHTILGYAHRPFLKESDFEYTLHEKYFACRILAQTPQACLAISYHAGYPYQEWIEGEHHIILEGVIYNRPDEDIRTPLNEIATAFARGEEYRNQIRRFVENSDGDYIVQIFNTRTQSLIIFNDFLGRLAPFYFCRDGLFVFSKEMKTILNFIPRLAWHKPSIVEYLMYEYPLGNKTLFQDIYRMQAAELLIVQKKQDVFRLASSAGADFNFTLREQFSSPEESIVFLRDSFLAASKHRIGRAVEKGYRLIADLSGGYDTRTVLAGLSASTRDVDYFTFEYIRNESPWAKAVFEDFDSPGRYHKLAFTQRLDEGRIGALVYNTDGLVNYLTTAACYNDTAHLKGQVREKAMRFSGLGGEFIRHPFALRGFSLMQLAEYGVYARLNLRTACEIANLDHHEYRDILKKYFDAYPEQSAEDRLKRFYYEYYHNFVGGAAEDRERMHFWTVQPLWNAPGIHAIFTRLPLRWVGFTYYIRFMRAIDPRLLRSPIWNSNIRLNSKMSAAFFDVKYRTNLYVRTLFKTRFSPVHRLLKSRFRRAQDQSDRAFKFYKTIAQKLHHDPVIDLPAIENKLFENESDSERIITLLLYSKELETRFTGKIAP